MAAAAARPSRAWPAAVPGAGCRCAALPVRGLKAAAGAGRPPLAAAAGVPALLGVCAGELAAAARALEGVAGPAAPDFVGVALATSAKALAEGTPYGAHGGGGGGVGGWGHARVRHRMQDQPASAPGKLDGWQGGLASHPPVVATQRAASGRHICISSIAVGKSTCCNNTALAGPRQLATLRRCGAGPPQRTSLP